MVVKYPLNGIWNNRTYQYIIRFLVYNLIGKIPTTKGLTYWGLSKLKHVNLHRQCKYLEFIKRNRSRYTRNMVITEDN